MRIVMFSASFPPEVGGIESHVYNLSRNLVKRGNAVNVVTIRRDSRQSFHSHLDGLEVFRILTRRFPKTRTLQYLVGATAVILWLHRQRHAELLHLHTFWPDAFTAFALRLFMPTVYTAHESYFLIMAEQKRYQRRLQLALSPFDQIIAPSTELLQVARRLGVRREMSAFIANAVEPETFSPQIRKGTVRRQYGIAETDILLVCPRRIVPKNGVDYFVRSLPSIMKNSPSVSVLIVGEGPERTRLEAVVRDMPFSQRVIFTGSVSNQEMPSVYADADIVVLPSLKEATSIAGLEAMASARPIVATSVGGLPEIVQDEQTGLLVPPKDPTAIAAAVSRLIRFPALREAMGLAARRRVEEEFTWEHAARKTERVYELAIRNWTGRIGHSRTRGE